MRTAIVGWGSLIWKPRDLELASKKWNDDGPHLPVEFARISNGGRLTLVIHPGSAAQQTLWALSALDSLEEVRENLKAREGTSLKTVHAIDHEGKEYGEGVSDEIASEMRRWLKQHPELHAVVWTGLSSNWQNKRGVEWSQQDALAYLNGLSGEALEKAREYIEKAPPQVDTELRRRIESERGRYRQCSKAKE